MRKNKNAKLNTQVQVHARTHARSLTRRAGEAALQKGIKFINHGTHSNAFFVDVVFFFFSFFNATSNGGEQSVEQIENIANVIYI